jgi:hypothetical protein
MLLNEDPDLLSIEIGYLDTGKIKMNEFPKIMFRFVDYKFNTVDLNTDDYRKYFSIRAKIIAVKYESKESEEKEVTETLYELENCQKHNF